MSRRTTRTRRAFVAIFILSGFPLVAPAADAGGIDDAAPPSARATANGTLSLVPAGRRFPAAAPDVEPIASESPPAGKPATPPVPEPTPARAAPASSAPPSALERRGLGVPNGTLSARPKRDAATEGSPDGLRSLDPRRNNVTRLVLALLLVGGLLLVVRVFLRRSGGMLGGGSRPAGVLEILARYPVARGQTLLVIKMARRLLLVHHGSTGMHTLSEITDPDEVAATLARMEAGSRSREAARFQSALRVFEREHQQLSRAELPASGAPGRDGIEVVDLTRRPLRRIGRTSTGRRLTA